MGESPCWDEKHQLLYFIDIIGKKLLCYSPIEQDLEEWNLPATPGTVVLADDKKLILAMSTGIFSFELTTSKLIKLSDPNNREHHASRFSDGKCDSYGRLWVGTTNMERKPVCKLYRFSLEDGLVAYSSGITISNGLCWSPDDKTMYHTDTYLGNIYSYDFDLDKGKITNRKAFINISKESGLADGMAIDSEGMIWVAHWGGKCVCRYHNLTAELLARIELPVKYPTACSFSGKLLNELYITSAQFENDEPNAGSLWKITLPVRGIPSNRFRLT